MYRSLFPLLILFACDGTEKNLDTSQQGNILEDKDGDGFLSDEDCDDSDPARHPNASEICDGLDNNCDGQSDEGALSVFYADADDDGFGNPDITKEACESGEGFVEFGNDCDDANAQTYPGAEEICDGVDNDCNGDTDEELQNLYYMDEDRDGFGDENTEVYECDLREGLSAISGDCDDSNISIHPLATEICDTIDNNCDGNVDENVLISYYFDEDQDGFGDPSTSVSACMPPEGYVLDGTDCLDTDSFIHPLGLEICDGQDNNCDGNIDEDTAFDATDWYLDADNDNYGSALTTQSACNQPTGYVDNSTDCNDSNAFVSPGSDELCDEIDNDCDGNIDEADAIDETLWFADADEDGYGDVSVVLFSCSAPNGYVADNSDCDDTDPQTYMGAAEICDDIDNNCDGNIDEAGALTVFTWYEDGDEDGYGDPNSSVQSCAQPTGYITDNTDCEDNDDDIHPGATELCNGEDENCDGIIDNNATDGDLWYEDGDEDGFGNPNISIISCQTPLGYAINPLDCDDTDENIHPSASELCNGYDDNCDGLTDDVSAFDAITWYQDADEDGFGDVNETTIACDAPSGYIDENTDCDDTDENIYPNAPETCSGIDDNCDQIIEELGSSSCPATTCYAILSQNPTAQSGVYQLQPNTNVSAVETYCDMDTDGGGWTLVGYSYMNTTNGYSGNNNFKSLKCGGGTYEPENRGTSSAAIKAVDIAQASTEMAISLSSASVVTGDMQSYSQAWKFTIPDPSIVTFVNAAYTSPGYLQSGPCTQVTVYGIVGDTSSYSRYTLAASLSNSWTDSYPTGYGAGDSNICMHENAGPFVTAIHSGSHNYPLGITTTECDVSQGSTTYAYRGNYSASGTGETGSAAIWFR